ncbi:hypothetical protein PVAP13_1KG466205 [Panicum virgatum]|uniref:Uncharacterized protein n=1 Tax=Panicum virgatum TaxID=38727 RepID=A0A8T0Y0C2_PANVG|nr:hypothetical protein PVAP13_1KG466205 [Panicum virgatum]
MGKRGCRAQPCRTRPGDRREPRASPHRPPRKAYTSSAPLHSPQSTPRLLLLPRLLCSSAAQFKIQTHPHGACTAAEPPSLLVRGRGTSGSPARRPIPRVRTSGRGCYGRRPPLARRRLIVRTPSLAASNREITLHPLFL